MKKIIIASIIFIFIAPYASASSLKGEITEFGIYNVASPKQNDLPGSISGRTQIGSGELIKKTTVIPLIRNTFFGFDYKISGFTNNEEQQFVITIKHPPIRTPDGNLTEKQTYQMVATPINYTVQSQYGYVINRDYEMVKGKWTFQIWFKNELILEQEFTTVSDNGSNN